MPLTLDTIHLVRVNEACEHQSLSVTDHFTEYQVCVLFHGTDISMFNTVEVSLGQAPLLPYMYKW